MLIRSMRLRFALRSLLLVVALLASAVAPARAEDMKTAVLQGLDKVTARISTFDAPVGQTVKFGSLEITARKCSKSRPEELPENAAFLEIREIARDKPPVNVFNGWMFSSSPAASAMEHPVYDVWITSCK